MRVILYTTVILERRFIEAKDPVIKAYYAHLIDMGKIKKVAQTACMRKLLVILNAILREHRPWSYAS
jgi:transposase